MASSETENEALRQEVIASLKDLSDDQGIDALFAEHGPGSFGMHEALHMSSFFLQSLSRHLLEHPAVVARPDLFAKGCAAHDALFELYQAIAAVHIADEITAAIPETD